jgi:rhodanese-related sulfurtransferase
MKRIIEKSTIAIVASVLFLSSCDDNVMTEEYTDVMASQIKMDLVDDANISPYMNIFDVSPVYSSGHLPGATNANAGGGGTALADLIDGMDKTKEYLVYCHGDAPAMAGAQLMEDAGFTKVYRLEGNYGAWVDAGYSVE